MDMDKDTDTDTVQTDMDKDADTEMDIPSRGFYSDDVIVRYTDVFSLFDTIVGISNTGASIESFNLDR
jgi:hypothetical protein